MYNTGEDNFSGGTGNGVGKILYDASYQFDIGCLIPVFLFIFGLYFPKIHKKSCEQKGEHYNESFVTIFMFVYRFFAVFVIVVMIISGIQSYKQVIVAYREGNYYTVEGYVENYVPMPYEGHAQESFTINGVEFAYSDYTVTQGYHNAASHGGVITHNGQHLKLRYVTTTDYRKENIIVYIEELP